MKSFPALILFFVLSAFQTVSAQSNSERIKMIEEQEEKENKVKDQFNGREVFVSADIYDAHGNKHRFYKIIRKFYVDILGDGFYFSWEEERGDYSNDAADMLFTYSVKIPFNQISVVGSYFTVMRHPIGTEEDHRKVACVVFKAKDGNEFEVFERTFDIINGKRVKKDSEYVKQKFVLVPYANMDSSCNACTHESLTERPRNEILKFLKDLGY